MQTSMHGIAESAKRFKTKRFRSLYSYLNHVTFERAYFVLNKKAAAGSDKVSWADYGRNLKGSLLDLEERLKQKRYRAKFLRRVLIPKGKDKYRPLSIPAIEDKIVHYAVREIISEFKQWCKECRNKRLKWIMVHVKSKLRGLRNYFGVTGNTASLREILYLFKRLLYKWLNRRSERESYNWKTFRQMLRFYNVEGSKKLVNQGVQLSFLQHLA